MVLLGDKIYWVGQARSELAVLDFKEWKWIYHGDCLMGIAGAHIAQLVDDKIYYFGGSGVLALVEFDTVVSGARKVETLNEGPAKRPAMSSVFAPWCNEIITFGGFFPGTFTPNNETHALDIETKAWIKLELCGRQPEPRYLSGATINGTKMYIYGGFGQQGILSDLWIAELGKYRPRVWSQPQTDALPIPREQPTFNLLNGVHIVFGGYGVENRKEVYVLFEKESTWHNQYSPKVAIKGDAPKNIQSHLAVSTAKGILFLTKSGIFLLTQEW